MKTPADGWDRDEREALEGLEGELESLRQRHAGEVPLELLRAARHDALPPDLQTDAAARLATDAWSRALVEGLDDAEASFGPEDQARVLRGIQRAARQDESRASSPIAWTWLRPVLAGAATVAIVGVVWLWRGNEPPARTPPAQPEGQTAAARPAAPRFEIPLEKPDVMLSAAALTWRGAAENPLLVDLKPAVDAFRQGDYTSAARQFAALENRYPNAIEVFYYGGVSRLFVNDTTGAVASLGRAAALADEVFAPHVTWYRAIAEQRAGRENTARAQLSALCAGSSARAARACEALKQLGTPNPR